MDWCEILKELLNQFGDHCLEAVAQELIRSIVSKWSEKSDNKKKANPKQKNRMKK
ncbi:hypothetical protein [Paenibacillus sp. PCH8]|uniref:hypothetical protein n=1 Tax=Paenibacillus sp. PCH8 TaxID=2066524 RepID=UPI0015E47FAE|nr:hypothetical protein [Paenibacillus sp. PCH8]